MRRLLRAWLPVTTPAHRPDDAGPPLSMPSEPEPPPVPVAPRFEARALWMPKRGNSEDEWEDAFHHDPGRAVAAVGDGASDGIFSKRWANLLTESFVAGAVDLDDPDAVDAWVRDCRRAWARAIDYPSLRWSLQMRVDRSCGAAAFLAFRLLDECPDPGGPITPNWRAWAVGDICLFWVRDRQLLLSFPAQGSGEFGTTPDLFRSKPMGASPAPVTTEGQCRPGDLFLFATDALAQRLLRSVEEGAPPDWERFWSVDPAAWRQEIEALRDRDQIVNDDCTLLAVRILGARPPVPEVAAPGPGTEPARTAPPPSEPEPDAP